MDRISMEIRGYFPKYKKRSGYSIWTGMVNHSDTLGTVWLRHDSYHKWDFNWRYEDWNLEGVIRAVQHTKSQKRYEISLFYINGIYADKTIVGKSQWEPVYEAVRLAMDSPIKPKKPEVISPARKAIGKFKKIFRLGDER